MQVSKSSSSQHMDFAWDKSVFLFSDLYLSLPFCLAELVIAFYFVDLGSLFFHRAHPNSVFHLFSLIASFYLHTSFSINVHMQTNDTCLSVPPENMFSEGIKNSFHKAHISVLEINLKIGLM